LPLRPSNTGPACTGGRADDVADDATDVDDDDSAGGRVESGAAASSSANVRKGNRITRRDVRKTFLVRTTIAKCTVGHGAPRATHARSIVRDGRNDSRVPAECWLGLRPVTRLGADGRRSRRVPRNHP
jgi:hypothetical protein